MTERERWIVYPLLFLALGAALRDKLFDQTTSRSIVCQELTVVDEEPVGLRPARVLAKIGRVDGPQSSSPPVGYLYVDGQVEVEGPIVARQFGTRGGSMGMALPAISAADLFQAVQQMVRAALQHEDPVTAKPTETDSEPAAEAAPATEPPPTENSPQSE